MLNREYLIPMFDPNIAGSGQNTKFHLLALGWAGSRGDALCGQLKEMGRRAPTFAVAALVVGLAVWHQPWSSGGANSASTSVVAGRFSPDGQLGPLVRAYLDGQLVRAIGLTFLVNLVLGALLYVTLPSLVLPFAEALSTEDHTPTIRRIRELLISFGGEGRRAVEPLKNSSKPAVRRTAVDLLRIFGGNDALKELTPLLNDADPHVQRDAVRAIVQIGTPEAFAVIDRGCEANDAALANPPTMKNSGIT